MATTASKTVLRIIVDDDARLCCPVCACDCVHIAGVSVEQGHTQTTISRDAAVVTPTDRHQRARGSVVMVDCWCESGHRFTYSLEFCKGNVFLELETSDGDEPDGELWRN